MSIRKTLRDLVKVVCDEAEHNPEFAERLTLVLKPAKRTRSTTTHVVTNRPANRRPQAVLDPVVLASQGENILRENLEQLNLEQLRDIVADYGMDPGKLVMKWKTPGRVIDRIVELSMTRARKGDAFRA